jgi:hypothetical protein
MEEKGKRGSKGGGPHLPPSPPLASTRIIFKEKARWTSQVDFASCPLD